MAVAPAPALSLSAAAGGGSLLFRQLFDADTGTFTYLLADVTSRQGLLIDSVFQQGNAPSLWTSITEQILTLPDGCLL